ncbi:MAG: TonB family protein [Candidatus Acidiferrales bacterium]
MSDLGNLSQCMMDGALETRAQRRALRRRALAASICFQAIVMTALILWPLFTPPALPKAVAVTPLPPFQGMPEPAATTPAPDDESASPRPAIVVTNVALTPPVSISRHIVSTGGPAAPSMPMSPAAPGAGPWIPGGSGNGLVVVERPSPPRIVRRSAGVMAASLVHRVEPAYSAVARAARIQGAVRLHAIIGTDGAVQQIEVISGREILAQAAIDAVRQWRYRPTLLNGQPVEVDTEITVNFGLE